MPNFAWLEVRISPTEPGRFSDPDIFPVQPLLEGSRFPVLNTPGLGIEVNEELILKQEFKFWEAPKLYRKDGSVQNW